jgi:hypothetical protein
MSDDFRQQLETFFKSLDSKQQDSHNKLLENFDKLTFITDGKYRTYIRGTR